MALTQINFTEGEEEIINHFSKEWKLNKPNTVQKIVSVFGQWINAEVII
jgi:hypothetical protein